MPSQQLAERRYPVVGESGRFTWSVNRDRKITSLIGAGAALLPHIWVGVDVDEANRDFPAISAFIDRLLAGEEVTEKVMVEGRVWVMEGGPCWLDGEVIGCQGFTSIEAPKPASTRQRWRVVGLPQDRRNDLRDGDVIVKTEGVDGIKKVSDHTDAEMMEWMFRLGRYLVPFTLQSDPEPVPAPLRLLR